MYDIKFDNPEEVENVKIVSTVKNEQKVMEAKYEPAVQAFIARGGFEQSNTSYIPGKISIQYEQKKEIDTEYVKKRESLLQNYNVFTETIEGVSKYFITEGNLPKSAAKYVIVTGLENSFTDAVSTGVREEMEKYGLTEEIAPALLDVTTEISNELAGKIIDELDEVKTLIYTDEKKLTENEAWGIATEGLEVIVFIANQEKEKIEIESSNMSATEKEVALEALEIETAESVLDLGILSSNPSLGLLTKFYKMAYHLSMSELKNQMNLLLSECGMGTVHIMPTDDHEQIIDPSGYVYEAVVKNRVPNVSATIYYKEDLDSAEEIKWDAEQYDQINPQITENSGIFAWFVPDGYWQVRFEADGYEAYVTDWMEVPPPRLDVNVGLISKDIPRIEFINVYDTYAEIKFSQYMDPESIRKIKLTDDFNEEIAYKLIYSEDCDTEGVVFADRYEIQFVDRKLKRGDAIKISSPNAFESYSGKELILGEKKYVCKSEPKLRGTFVSPIEIEIGKTKIFTFKVEDCNENELEIMSNYEAFASIEKIEKDKEGTIKVTVKGNLVGETELIVKVLGTSIETKIPIFIDFSLADGQIDEGNDEKDDESSDTEDVFDTIDNVSDSTEETDTDTFPSNGTLDATVAEEQSDLIAETDTDTCHSENALVEIKETSDVVTSRHNINSVEADENNGIIKESAQSKDTADEEIFELWEESDEEPNDQKMHRNYWMIACAGIGIFIIALFSILKKRQNTDE